ncbi:MAG TPA: transporter [Planctomycetaceae bacterium]|nr:transporter [Planctomycetaceae bacterium]
MSTAVREEFRESRPELAGTNHRAVEPANSPVPQDGKSVAGAPRDRQSTGVQLVSALQAGPDDLDADSAAASDSDIRVVPGLPADEGLPGNQVEGTLKLDEVIGSVYQSFPLLDAALRQRDIAAGDQMAAAGAYDLKLLAGSENQPLGYYETYRNTVKVAQPLYSGGEAFAAYRNGRGGQFEPWYLERATNEGGEFKAGVLVPFSRNRTIDERRANVWKTTYGRQQVEYEIQAELIDFVQAASYAYWEWVAAGERYQVASTVLDLARQRNAGIERQVELGDKEPPLLQDNRRLIMSREAKQIEAGRKLQMSAVKLSLYLRDASGKPFIPSPEQLPEFPAPGPVVPDQVDADIQLAVERRPELRVLDLLHRQLEVDLAQAHNDFRPAVDGFMTGSQDVGEPTSKKMDKSQFELEAGVMMELSVQRRKARGKSAAVEAKLAQVNAKRRITQDKVVIEVQQAYQTLVAARDKVERAREAQRLADQMAAIERRKFALGDSDLLAVNLREQQAAEAAETLIDTLLEAFRAEADYRAALAWDEPPGA